MYVVWISEIQKRSFADVLLNRCPLKFRNVYRKTPVLKFLFNKVAGVNTTILFKKTPTSVFSCEIGEMFQNTFFNRTHPVATSGNISWTLSLLHMGTMSGVISWTLTLQRLFHFIACVSFLSISFLFSYVFVDSTTWWGIELSLSIPKIKQWSCS